jgi:hypothetical protein
MFRLMESLVYEAEPATVAKVETLLAENVKALSETAKDKLESKKGEIMGLKKATEYMEKCKSLPGATAAKIAMEALIKANGWDKK